MFLWFPYKDTPFIMVGKNTLPSFSYPVVAINGEDIYFFHSYNGKPDEQISEQEYLNIIRRLEYQEEFEQLVNNE